MSRRSCLNRYIITSTMRTFTGKSCHIASPMKQALLSSLDYFVKNPRRSNQSVERTAARRILSIPDDLKKLRSQRRSLSVAVAHFLLVRRISA